MLDPAVRELLEAIHGMLDTPLPASLVEAWKARDRTIVVLAAVESVLDPASHVTAKDAARYLRDRLGEVERAAAAVEALEDENDVRAAREALAEPGPSIPAAQVWAELGLADQES